MGGRSAYFVEQQGEVTQNKLSKSFQDTIQFDSLSIYSQSSSQLLREEIMNFSKRAVERVQDPGTLGIYSRLFLIPKKHRKLRPLIDLSLLNLYIKKPPFKMETVKSVRQSILVNNWAVSIDLTVVYLHVPILPHSRKYLRFMLLQVPVLPFGMPLSPWIFTKLMDVIRAHLLQRAISLFPYLDVWLIRNLIHNYLISHTIYCLQTVQSLGFIPNLKKSYLKPA